MRKIIDTHIITKNIDLDKAPEEIKILNDECLEWINSNGYEKYIIMPTFTIVDKKSGLIEYKLEVLQYFDKEEYDYEV